MKGNSSSKHNMPPTHVDEEYNYYEESGRGRSQPHD
jgi:hypothetical protein